MANILNTQIPSQALTSGTQVSVDAAISKLHGQMATLQMSASNAPQLVLNGQTLSLPRQVQTQVKPNQQMPVLLKVKEQATQTFLEIVKPGNISQSLQLTPTQGQQILNVIAQTPSVLANYTPGIIQAQVMKVSNEQLVLQISGKTITLNVPNASARFKEGQSVSLKLLNQGEKWQLEIKSGDNKAVTQKVDVTHSRQLPQIMATTLPRNVPLSLDNQDKTNHINIQKILPLALQAGFKPEANKLPMITIDKHMQIKLQWNQVEQAIAKLPLEGNLKQKALDLVVNVPSGVQLDNKAVNITKPQVTSTVSQQLSMEMLANSEKSVSAPSPRQTLLNQVDGAKIRSDLQPLMRILQAKVESPSTLLNTLEKSLGSLSISNESPISGFVSEMSKLIQNDKVAQTNGQILPQDIKQLMTANPVSITPATLNSPPPQANFLAGLMGMLQISLASRLARHQPEHVEKLTQMIMPSLVSGATKTSGKQQIGKGLSDFFQADSKFQILKNLDKLISGHQFNKLSSMEAQLQGQDSLYYVLPVGDNGQRKDVEILVKREQEREKQADKAKSKGTYWALTMKLPVGDIGQILAKAKINGSKLDLDFYTSNDQTRELVLNFLPVLRKRFDQLGIDMGKCQCQLGKIPEALQQRPYHLFEARA